MTVYEPLYYVQCQEKVGGAPISNIVCTDTAFHCTALQEVLVGKVTNNGAGEMFYYVSNFSEATVWPSKWKITITFS